MTSNTRSALCRLAMETLGKRNHVSIAGLESTFQIRTYHIKGTSEDRFCIEVKPEETPSSEKGMFYMFNGRGTLLARRVLNSSRKKRRIK